MKTKRVALIAAGLTAFTLLSGFHGGCGHRTFNAERAEKYVNMHVDDELDDLKATPTQRAAIHAQVNAVMPEAIKLREENQAAKAEAVKQLQSDKPDAAKLHALVDQRMDAVRAFAHRVVDAALSAHQTLTPEQRKQVNERIQERME
jgi:Spy/CpxP family protein refolding chaperone